MTCPSLFSALQQVILIAGHANFDHMVNVLSAGFLHCEVLVFPFISGNYLGGTTLRLYEYRISPQIFTNRFLAFISESTIITMVFA